MPRNLDNFQLYFATPYVINDKLSIHQPTLGDVIALGEQEYFLVVSALTAIPSDMKSALDDIGIDWEEISDFKFFYIMTRGLGVEKTRIFFGDLDFTKFELYQRPDGNLYMYNEESDITIDEYLHHLIAEYICKLHSIIKKPERAGNEMTKQILIDEDRREREYNSKQEYKSTLLPLISSMLNSPGFKYKKTELPEVGIYEFYDSVSRIALVKSVDYMASGLYSGNIDVSKFNMNKLDWMAELHN